MKILCTNIFVTVFISLFSNTLAQDRFVNAASFDGNKNYIEVPHSNVLNFGKTYTIEFWLKMNDNEPANILNKWASNWNGGPQGWSLEINRGPDPDDTFPFNDPLSGVPYPGAIYFITSHSKPDGAGGWGRGMQSSGFEVGEWGHIAITVNADIEKERLYTNGVSRRSGWNGALSEDYNAKGYPLNIGGYRTLIDSTLYFNGLLDELRVWSKERNGSQIQSTMWDTLGPDYYSIPDSGLILYYRFDQLENLGVGDDGLDDDIRDLSYYQNHGDILGTLNLNVSDIMKIQNVNYLDLPTTFVLEQNYPNPFNSSTTIFFKLPKSNFVTLKLYNLMGKEIETLIREHKEAGNYQVVWNAKDLPSGMYLYRLEAGDYVETKKTILQR